MKYLMFYSRVVDAVNDLVGKLVMWLILLATVISAANAISRYAFSISSNAFLEIQWYLFGAVFLLGGGYAFLRNAHVRIDVLSSRMSPRFRNWVDIIGITFFLLPLCYMMITMGWPIFERAWQSGEVSSSAGGLIRWPAYLLIPVGFGLLGLQGISELIKRFNYLFAGGPDPLQHTGPSETQLLANDIAEEEKSAVAASQGGQKS
jgi:TRAP-type mannitol/chloroaromatic compound transport system permease small subunit